MDIRSQVREMRRLLAPILDEYSLEILDVVMMDEEWMVARSMALESAAFHRFEFPTELLQMDSR